MYIVPRSALNTIHFLSSRNETQKRLFIPGYYFFFKTSVYSFELSFYFTCGSATKCDTLFVVEERDTKTFLSF